MVHTKKVAQVVAELERSLDEYPEGISRSLLRRYISPAYLSEIFNGKKRMPFELAAEIFCLSKLSLITKFRQSDPLAVRNLNVARLSQEQMDEILAELEKLAQSYLADVLRSLVERTQDEALASIKRPGRKSHSGEVSLKSDPRNIYWLLAKRWSGILEMRRGKKSG